MQTSTYTFTSSIACFRTPWRSTLTTPQIVAPAERMHIGRAPYGMGAKLAENIGHAADAFPVPLPRSLPTAPAAVPRWRMGRSIEPVHPPLATSEQRAGLTRGRQRSICYEQFYLRTPCGVHGTVEDESPGISCSWHDVGASKRTRYCLMSCGAGLSEPTTGTCDRSPRTS